jgi:hypothetical protein
MASAASATTGRSVGENHHAAAGQRIAALFADASGKAAP